MVGAQCCLPIAFAKSLNLDQDRQSCSGCNLFATDCAPERFFKKVNFEKSQQRANMQ